MKIIYRTLETRFEKFAAMATKIYGNSITFIVALVLVIVYLVNENFHSQSLQEIIKDIILCITFLSFFIIQKTVNRFSTALHLKVNELVASQENASNRMINVEDKTEAEMNELSKHYSSLIEKINSSDSDQTSHTIDTIIEEKEKKDAEDSREG